VRPLLSTDWRGWSAMRRRRKKLVFRRRAREFVRRDFFASATKADMLYDWLKGLHVISVIAWMAGMLYLPRLFVYHVPAKPGSELSETLKIMERRLLRAIINPAMIATFVFGIWMLALNPDLLHQTFMLIKLSSVFLLAVLHGFLARYRRAFAEDRNIHSTLFFRILNEVPTALMIVIVLVIFLRPGS
jgi:putative membrane protein